MSKKKERKNSTSRSDENSDKGIAFVGEMDFQDRKPLGIIECFRIRAVGIPVAMRGPQLEVQIQAAQNQGELQPVGRRAADLHH